MEKIAITGIRLNINNKKYTFRHDPIHYKTFYTALKKTGEFKSVKTIDKLNISLKNDNLSMSFSKETYFLNSLYFNRIYNDKIELIDNTGRSYKVSDLINKLIILGDNKIDTSEYFKNIRLMKIGDNMHFEYAILNF